MNKTGDRKQRFLLLMHICISYHNREIESPSKFITTTMQEELSKEDKASHQESLSGENFSVRDSCVLLTTFPHTEYECCVYRDGGIHGGGWLWFGSCRLLDCSKENEIK